MTVPTWHSFSNKATPLNFFQIVPPTRTQTFKFMSLWGRFHSDHRTHICRAQVCIWHHSSCAVHLCPCHLLLSWSVPIRLDWFLSFFSQRKTNSWSSGVGRGQNWMLVLKEQFSYVTENPCPRKSSQETGGARHVWVILYRRNPVTPHLFNKLSLRIFCMTSSPLETLRENIEDNDAHAHGQQEQGSAAMMPMSCEQWEKSFQGQGVVKGKSGKKGRGRIWGSVCHPKDFSLV